MKRKGQEYDPALLRAAPRLARVGPHPLDPPEIRVPRISEHGRIAGTPPTLDEIAQLGDARAMVRRWKDAARNVARLITQHDPAAARVELARVHALGQQVLALCSCADRSKPEPECIAHQALQLERGAS